MRRCTAVAHARSGFELAMLLALAALLASTAALGASTPRELYSAVANLASPEERSVDRRHDQSNEQRGAKRTSLLRATAPAISRPPTPGGAGGGGSRGGFALGVPSALLDLVATREPEPITDARHGDVPSPGRPTPPSRAPPLA